MLLLNRKVNESITTWKQGEKDDPLVIRVTEVSPSGTVTLGFEGENPAESLGKIMASAPEEFAVFALDVHGLDMKGPPPPLPQIVYDSRA